MALEDDAEVLDDLYYKGAVKMPVAKQIITCKTTDAVLFKWNFRS